MSNLNRELMEKWVAALRSGEYKQGKDYLCQPLDDGGALFCCLGVLQAIEPRIKKLIDEDIGEDELLDEDSLKWFMGVDEQDGFFQKRYSGWNDGGDPFPIIAGRLERQWLNKEEDKI